MRSMVVAASKEHQQEQGSRSSMYRSVAGCALRTLGGFYYLLHLHLASSLAQIVRNTTRLFQEECFGILAQPLQLYI
jgi:hypothetical protein